MAQAFGHREGHLSPGAPLPGLSDVKWLAIASKLYPATAGSRREMSENRGQRAENRRQTVEDGVMGGWGAIHC